MECNPHFPCLSVASDVHLLSLRALPLPMSQLLDCYLDICSVHLPTAARRGVHCALGWTFQGSSRCNKTFAMAMCLVLSWMDS